MKVGDAAYIRLEGFTPEWRQAVIVSENSLGHLVLAVRVLKNELELQRYSSFEIASDTASFILVEGDRDRIRESCSFPHRALEVEPQKLLTNARVLQEDEEVTYATASEDLPKEKSKPKTSRRPLEIDSGSDSGEGSGDSEDAIADLLKRAGKTQQERGMPSEKRVEKDRRGDRYPMLENKSQTQQLALPPSSLEDLLPKVTATGGGKGIDINALIQLELLKELRGRGKSSRAKQTDTEDANLTSGTEDSSSVEDVKLRGAGKALRAYRKSRKSKRKNPLKYVRRYVREVEDQLGVTENSSYKLIDFTKRLQWGKFKTLMRYHYALSEVLQELLKGRSNQAALQITQLLRATHQVALDNGEWKTAWLLLDLPDPIDRPRFGGEPQDLETVAAYVRAMSELEKKSKSWGPRQSEEEDTSTKGKGKRGKKGSKSEKSEEKTE